MKVQVPRSADLVDFGPELIAAKSLIDECLNECPMTAGRDPVDRHPAFNTDKEGKNQPV